MDMNTAFGLEVRRHCPKARVGYDLFHVIAKYGREVIGRVRVTPQPAPHDKPVRRVVKQAHWLLLRNPTNVKTPAYKVRIDEVLAANQSLMTVYVIKEQLRMLWTAPIARTWRSAWNQWMAHAQESGIPARSCSPGVTPLLTRHSKPGALAHAHRPVGRRQQQDQGHQADGLRLPR